MAKNAGKKFESIIKDDCPDYVKITRIPDPPQSFVQRSDTLFSRKNPYDYEIFDSIHRILYCWELKSTSQKYMSYQIDKYDNKSTNIKWRQSEGLLKVSKYCKCIAVFLINFR